MNQTVQIRRLTAHYRLRPSQMEERRRLDAVLRDVVSDALDLALERAGVRTNEVVCIRKLHVPVQLRLSRADSGLAADWAKCMAEAIQFAAMEPFTTVRYGSRRLALIDMGSDIAHGRFHNVWAWRQIGFWLGMDEYTNLADAVDELAGALCREPEAALAVLATLGSRGELRSLAPHLEKAWPAIAAAVLEIAGVGGSDARRQERQLGFTREFERESRPARSIVSLTWDRLETACERSLILRSLHDIALAEREAKSVVLLALLECEPSLVRASTGQLFDTMRAVYEMKFAQQARRTDSVGKPSTSVVKRKANVELRSSARPAAQTPSSPISTDRAPSQSEQAALRTEGLTGFGGLLYLLNIVDHLQIPERVLALPEIAARGLAWFQHRLALRLQAMAPDDPAALAFCGLGPAVAHPSQQQPLPVSEEQELIDAFAAEVQRTLAELLPESTSVAEKLTQFVCRRPARVVADPGWLEVRFSLKDVSLEIRRAGLDIDPDYLPWLGVVVRFVYE